MKMKYIDEQRTKLCDWNETKKAPQNTLISDEIAMKSNITENKNNEEKL